MAGRAEPTLFDDREPVTGDEATLDELVTGVWEELSGHRSASCPVCAGAMVPGYGAHARVVAGGCTECGTTLS